MYLPIKIINIVFKQIGKNPLTDYIVVKIPMSDYQLGLYEIVRSAERKEELRKRKPTKNTGTEGLYDEPSSTYRIFSRLYCNFVMPLPPGRPRRD